MGAAIISTPHRPDNFGRRSQNAIDTNATAARASVGAMLSGEMRGATLLRLGLPKPKEFGPQTAQAAENRATGR